MMTLKEAVDSHIEKYAPKIEKFSPHLAEMYRVCYPSTIYSAVKKMSDSTYFVITGDIPAMWLRDSTAQVSNYVSLCKDCEEARELIKGVIRRQSHYIKEDPYANAFNESANGHGHVDDVPKKADIVWERKYETDSLCYPVRLMYLYYKETGDIDFIKEVLPETAEIILAVWRTEQHHFEKSPYRFSRTNCPYHDTLHNDGMGSPVKYTGMTWSGFRPSDDACEYGYLTASNMFACAVLGYISEMLSNFNNEYSPLIAECISLRADIKEGINKFAVCDNEKYGKIYACETDGRGNRLFFDDANVPSLLSIPYIGYSAPDDEIYKNTRRFILSKDNPYYYEGKFARGVGSPHTPKDYIWHIALSMQGLTSDDKDEMLSIVKMLDTTDAGTCRMHEGFYADDPNKFTREWFTWSDSLFSEFIEKAADENVI